MRLSKNDHAAAAGFLKSTARPLEKALYEHLFEGASPEPAVFALAAFQNPDGGFGKGLEPDLQLADSSVIATTHAFANFRLLGLKAGHPMVEAAARYLNGEYIESEHRWRIMPANVDDAPHAPWWQPGGDLWNSRVNPTAEILGYMYEYESLFDADRREHLTDELVAWLDSQGDTLEMHDLLCFVALVENPGVPDAVKLKFMTKLTTIVENTVDRTPEKWEAYGLAPLSVIDSPDSAFTDLFGGAVQDNIDFLVDQRAEDGGWHPAWQWGEPAEWQDVERAWAGVITLRNLRVLRAFDAIAGVKPRAEGTGES